jgi:hypothetical protein
VFCGSNPGRRPSYLAAADAVGRLLAERGLGVVYGGGKVGMMGRVADAALAAGGEVIGVIPHALATAEVAHTGLTELHAVHTMHQRKAKMSELADAFIALPGGFGTLEELFEMITWAQLGIHPHPVGLLDIDGYYTPLQAFIDRCVTEGFIRAPHRDLLYVDTDATALLNAFAAHGATSDHRWLRKPPPRP